MHRSQVVAFITSTFLRIIFLDASAAGFADVTAAGALAAVFGAAAGAIFSDGLLLPGRLATAWFAGWMAVGSGTCATTDETGFELLPTGDSPDVGKGVAEATVASTGLICAGSAAESAAAGAPAEADSGEGIAFAAGFISAAGFDATGPVTVEGFAAGAAAGAVVGAGTSFHSSNGCILMFPYGQSSAHFPQPIHQLSM